MNFALGQGPAKRPSGALDWPVERGTWPHAEFSRFVDAGDLRWHLQQMGEGPAVLLVHGTGASSHSWRSLAPLLARRFTVIAPDLPGHGFTDCPPRRRLSLPEMARAVASLIDELAVEPQLVVGHSAGAAILLRCCLDASLAPDAAISVNGALLPFRGTAGYLFPPLAKLLFLNPLMPRIFARSAASQERVARLIDGTGSKLDDAGIELYARLFTNSQHVAATLGMMAHWELNRLHRDLPDLRLPLLLIAAENDLAVSPDDAERVCRMVPSARVARLPGVGHLAHEEDADAVARLIIDFCASDATGKVASDMPNQYECD